jgi:hypothetical protein
MIPPTSIDGTDITGATIDGTDVQEITVDGDVVFSAAPSVPVAASNLVAWWPFRGNGNDVTAGDSTFGDTTDYSATTNSGNVTFPSDGVLDPFASNNQASEYDGSNYLRIPNSVGNLLSGSETITIWLKKSEPTQNYSAAAIFNNANLLIQDDGVNASSNSGSDFDARGSFTPPTDEYYHIAYTNNSGATQLFFNGSLVNSGTLSLPYQDPNRSNSIGAYGLPSGPVGEWEGLIDDFRIYNTPLSQSDIQQIISNTDPN